jgi:hypothetical protein
MPAFGRHTVHLDILSVNDPTISDDQVTGVDIGSEWFNTSTGNAFICLSAAAGAAVWKQVATSGQNESGTVAGGGSLIHGGDAVSAAGGSLTIRGGNATGGNNNGGNLVLEAGASVGSGTNGHILIVNGPTADPHIAGALYWPAVAGAVSVSGG